MQPLESMRRQMESLHFYDGNRAGSLSVAEGKACAECLQIAYDGLLEMEREAYLVSAKTWGLTGKCAALAVADCGACQREAALRLLRAGVGRNTRRELLDTLQAVGLSGPVYEQFSKRCIFLCPDAPPTNPKPLAAFLRRLLPAHLTLKLDLRGVTATWKAWESKTASWNEWEKSVSDWKMLENKILQF